MTIIPLDRRSSVIAQHVHVGCWLDDLPGTVRSIEYFTGSPRVNLEATDPAPITDKLGTPITFSGDKGVSYTWEHPEGFYVGMFVYHAETVA